MGYRISRTGENICSRLLIAFSLLCIPGPNSFADNPPPGGGEKMCDFKPSGSGQVPVCVVGGRNFPCKADNDCKKKRCSADGQCSINGNLGLCDGASCDVKNCFQTSSGPRCLLGYGGELNCTEDPGSCDSQKFCSWPIGAASPKCEVGGRGAPCEDANEDCGVAACLWDEVTGERKCVLGGQGTLACSSPADCPVPDLRCGSGSQGNRCLIGGSGALCKTPGVNEACNKLFCSSFTDQGKTIYKCVPSAEANSNIACSEGAANGSSCNPPETRCRWDDASKSGVCSVDGNGAPCSSNSQCGEKRCEGTKCMLGGFGKICASDSFCEVKRCNPDSGQCELDSKGEGGFACKHHSECLQHFKCSEGTCVGVAGPGFNTCDPNQNTNEGTNPQCRIYHKECVEGSRELRCTSVAGAGEDRCTVEPDNCDSVDQHKKCIFDSHRVSWSCNSVLGVGAEECEYDGDCGGLQGRGERRYRLNEKVTVPLQASPLSPSEIEELLSTGGAAFSVGSDAAPVKVTLFQDLTCGMCNLLHTKVFADLKRDYIETGKVQFFFRDFPLIPKPEDLQFAYGARCAGSQGKYLEFVDLHYAEKGVDAEDLARRLKLDTREFSRCIVSDEVKEAVKKDKDLGTKLYVTGTPDVFINGNNFGGYRPYDQWKAYLNPLLAKG